MLKILLVTLSTFVICLSKPNSLYAFTEIYDEFNSMDNEIWSLYPRDGSITAEGGTLNLNPPAYGGLSPYILGKFDTLLEEGTGIEFKFKTNTISFHGMGISVGFTGVTDYPFYEFSLWFDTYNPGVKFEYNDYSISKYNCTSFIPWKDIVDRKVTGVNLISNDWNIYRLTRNDGIYSVYLNNLEIGSSIVSYANNNCLPKNVILGNPLYFEGYSWSSFSIDYVKNFYLDNYPTLEEKTKKYILIPGLGASWNTKAMVYDDVVDIHDWTMTPFVNNYDNISDFFEDETLDFSIWNYDWRKPLLEIVQDFEEYVDDNIEDDDEVYVIGHSLGGLVARMWYQKNSDDVRIGKVVSVGSPHKGAIKAYEAYNGVKLSDGFDFSGVIWNLYLTLINQGGSTKVETVRELAPILLDLSPTYEFLSKNNVLFPKEESKYFNSNLSDWNSNFNNWDKVWPIAGTGEETKYQINLKNRSIFDQVLDLWPDGKPKSYEYLDGDGTVVVESAGYDKENKIEIVGGHDDLVNVSINEIKDLLGFEEDGVEELENEYEGRLFYLGSPAVLKVKCEGIDEKSDNNGFIFVGKNESEGNCQIKILGSDEGIYHLVIADTLLNSWQYFENEIKKDEELILDVDTNAKIVNTVNSQKYLYGLVLNDINLLEKLGIKDDFKIVKKAIIKKDVEYIIDWSLRFRKKHKEELFTKRIVENCLKIGPSHKVYAKMIWQKNYLKVAENFLERAERLSVLKRFKGRGVDGFEANNYFWMENIVDRIKNSSNGGEQFLLFRVLVKIFTMF
jgi:pimeloyl-ACP methyl ester carboxylesterase